MPPHTTLNNLIHNSLLFTTQNFLSALRAVQRYSVHCSIVIIFTREGEWCGSHLSSLLKLTLGLPLLF